MRSLILLAGLAVPFAAVAQAAAPLEKPAQQAESVQTGCVTLLDGDAAPDPYACLNARLRGLSEAKAAEKATDERTTVPSLNAQSDGHRLGSFNLSAERLRAGPNFGVSAAPYRPAGAVSAPPRAP